MPGASAPGGTEPGLQAVWSIQFATRSFSLAGEIQPNLGALKWRAPVTANDPKRTFGGSASNPPVAVEDAACGLPKDWDDSLRRRRGGLSSRLGWSGRPVGGLRSCRRAATSWAPPEQTRGLAGDVDRRCSATGLPSAEPIP
jgi:hypothetical protein